MEKYSPLEQKFSEMLKQQDFTDLDNYKVPSLWDSYSSSELRMLALAFVALGRKQLKEGNEQALEQFAMAAKIAPNQPIVLYAQAEAYASQNQNVRCLTLACKALQSATELEPTFFDAWAAWGRVLTQLANVQQETTYCIEANEKFLEAERHVEGKKGKAQAIMYWQWGICWSLLGQSSGEPYDFQCGIEKYRLAAEFDIPLPEFWCDYANILAELALLIGKNDLFLEAAGFFRKALEHAPNYGAAVFNLACCYLRLFLTTHDEDFFQLADEAFERASEINADHLDLWLNWGRLCVFTGKLKGEMELIQMSFEKFARANACDPNNPFVLCRWAEAQMIHGAQSEKVELLRGAEEKLVRSLELLSDNPETWGVYGTCLTELGRYFSEEGYYFQAIEKFRYGLSLNQKSPALWHGLAMAYFAIGDLHEDVEMIEQSVRCCTKVMEHGGDLSPQFWNDWGVALMKWAEITHNQEALESAIDKFERAIGWQEEEEDLSIYEPEWLYNYGCAFDFLGEFTENPEYYEKAILILAFLVNQDPNYYNARYNLALSLANLGGAVNDVDCFYKSLEHFQHLLNEQQEDESAWNDWGMALLDLAQLVHDPVHPENSQKYYEQAENKFLHAVALGSSESFYHLACLYSLMGNHSASMHYIERSASAETLPPIDDVLHDEWLEGVRATPEFRNFITLLSQKQKFE